MIYTGLLSLLLAEYAANQKCSAVLLCSADSIYPADVDGRYAAPAAIGRYLAHAPELSGKLAERRCRYHRRNRQTTYGRTLHRFITLTAYYADRAMKELQ